MSISWHVTSGEHTLRETRRNTDFFAARLRWEHEMDSDQQTHSARLVEARRCVREDWAIEETTRAEEFDALSRQMQRAFHVAQAAREKALHAAIRKIDDAYVAAFEEAMGELQALSRTYERR